MCVGCFRISLSDGPVGPDWRKNYCIVCFSTQHWRWCPQKPRGSKDPWYFQGMIYDAIKRDEISSHRKESTLLQAASPFYKTFAIECSRAQVSVDMFLFSSAYQDVASLGMSFCYSIMSSAVSELSRSLSSPLHLWPDVLLPCIQCLAH